MGLRAGKGDLSQAAGDVARKRAALELIARYEPVSEAHRAAILAGRGGRRRRLPAGPGDRPHQSPDHGCARPDPLDADGDQARGDGGAPGSRKTARRPQTPATVPAPRPTRWRRSQLTGEGPDEQAERREAIARSREALRSLKPAELRALSLLAEGYSYAEIGELTGYSHTKTNRLLAEGRNRFRQMLSSSEDGSRCRELRPLLSAFCDGEASAGDAETVREHLRACAHCRATMRAYRAAPRIAVALAPALPPSRSLLERAHDLFAGIGSRLSGVGGGGDAATQIAAAGGSRGAGMAALAKLLAVCAGAGRRGPALRRACCRCRWSTTAGRLRRRSNAPSAKPVRETGSEAIDYEPAQPQNPVPEAKPERPPHEEAAEARPPKRRARSAGAVEYEPPPAPAPAPSRSESAASNGSPAGEFGP